MKKRYILLIIYFILSFILEKSMFLNGEAFTSQMNAVEMGVKHSLKGIHTVRFLIVLPFYLVYRLNLSNFINSIIILIYIYPVFVRKDMYIKIIILLIILLFSYRTAIVSFSLIYLDEYITTKNKKFLITAIFFSVLSSGSLLVVLISFFIYKRQDILRSKALISILFLFCLLFLPSIFHKILFFTKEGGFFSQLFYRGYLFEAFREKNFSRILICIIFYIILIREIINIFLKGSIKNREIIMGLILPFSLIEGLGIYTFLIWIFLPKEIERIEKTNVKNNFFNNFI